MVPNVSKDADSIRNFKRESNTLAYTDRQRILARLDSLKASAGRQFIAIQEIINCTLDRPFSLFTESIVGSFEASQSLDALYSKSHFLAASKVGEQILYVVECLALGHFEVRVMFNDGPPEVHHFVV